MITAQFQGVFVPNKEHMMKVRPDMSVLYTVNLREVGTGHKLIYAATLAGGSIIARGTLDKVKEKVEGMFLKKVKEWSET